MCVLPVCRGVGAGCNTKEVLERLRDLRAEVEDLDLKERELDQQKLWLQQSIRNVMDDTLNSRYPFPWLHITALGRGVRSRASDQQALPDVLPAKSRCFVHCV